MCPSPDSPAWTRHSGRPASKPTILKVVLIIEALAYRLTAQVRISTQRFLISSSLVGRVPGCRDGTAEAPRSHGEACRRFPVRMGAGARALSRLGRRRWLSVGQAGESVTSEVAGSLSRSDCMALFFVPATDPDCSCSTPRWRLLQFLDHRVQRWSRTFRRPPRRRSGQLSFRRGRFRCPRSEGTVVEVGHSTRTVSV